MRKSIFNLTLVLSIALTSSIVGQEQNTQAKRFDELAKAFQKKYKPPGFTVAVAQNNKIVFEKAYGKNDLENNIATKPESVFRTASIAKPITAIAVLQLVEQGKIKLDDPIQKHCPEFPKTEHPLTVRHLLCHQGGIRHYKSSAEAAGKSVYFSIADSIKLFKDDKLLAKPGDRYRYTTYGYSLLGRAVETASGMRFRDYLQKHVFDACGMSGSGVDDFYRIIPNRSRGYAKISPAIHRQLPKSLQAKIKPGEICNCQLHDTSMKIPGGGIVSTSRDLVRFGLAVHNAKLIKAKTRDLAWTRQKTSDGKQTSYGLGWFVNEQEPKLIYHSGGQAGTSTFLAILPENDVVIAVMCNLQGTPCAQLVRTIGKSILETQKKQQAVDRSNK